MVLLRQTQGCLAAAALPVFAKFTKAPYGAIPEKWISVYACVGACDGSGGPTFYMAVSKIKY